MLIALVPERDRRTGGDRRARAFTLFEIAVSLGLVAVAVVSILVLFPAGLRQLTNDRYRAYSACLVNQLVDVYGCADTSCVFTDHEAPGPWDISIDSRANAPDLEMRCSNARYGLLPVPTAIARRFDSDAGEIARLLDEGGQLYYVQPNVANAWREDLLPAMPPNDLQRVVVGVVGYAQNNAAFSFPLKRWPYYAAVPGPPLHAIHHKTYGWTSTAPSSGATVGQIRDEGSNLPAFWFNNQGTYCWECCIDPDAKLAELFDAFWDYVWIGGVGQILPTDYAGPGTLGPQFKAKLGAYIDKAIAYADSAGLTATEITDLMDKRPPAPYSYDTISPEVAAKKVLATCYLAHALFSLTRWHKLAGTTSSGDPQLAAPGFDLAAAYGIAPTINLGFITHDRLVNLVRNARWHYFRYIAQNPYDWAVPRAIEHANCMDYALLEPDLFREPQRGRIWGAPASVADASWWKYIAPTPIASITGGNSRDPLGANLTYPMSALPMPSLTDPGAAISENGPATDRLSHFTLCNQFEASERCRQIVVWAVDWQAYDDAETCPSAPVDAGRYPKAAPGGVKPDAADPRAWTDQVAPATTFEDLMWGFTDGWGDGPSMEDTVDYVYRGKNPVLHRALIGTYVHVYRNPEKNVLFTSDVTALPTGADVSARKIHDIDRSVMLTDDAARQTIDSPPDYGPPGAAQAGCGEPPAVFAGAFGADRNGNDRLDRGPLPASTRLRAVTIARYAYYDMRVPCQIR